MAALLAVAGLTVSATVTSAAPSAPTDRSAGSASGPARATAHVTLVTGDTVGVDGQGRVTDVRPGKGREGVGHSVRHSGGHTYVIPFDAAKLLADGRLDRRLFDVTELVKDGYDDARHVLATDTDVERRLPAVHGEALTADKADAAKAWRALTDPVGRSNAVTAAPGIDRVWLDGRVTVTSQVGAALDPKSGVARIGAPAAWKAGYDGKGVKVAVLDSGIDATHPDVKNSLLAAKDFTGGGSPVDLTGHGTHVASTILGSGAMSGGKYRGVAPGAKLLVGKVTDDFGHGSDSQIIAGMQWAVAQGAKVVNMSLGTPDTPGTNPLEKAVNDLSASSGALFVVAAGNEGPSDGSLVTPGSAASALTVAAVDHADKIAVFSGRGPNADGALKPDIAAPGVGIIAAKAAHSEAEPVAPGYAKLEGTSMATPHVAGAAAILAQEHPDWTGQRIKAALMASAKPLTGTTGYQVGAGRVDLTRAIDATVTAEPASAAFGTQAWPHGDDTAVTKTLTYRNSGTRPVTLDLAAAASAPGGGSASAGMFTVSPARLTVPAGGTAQATATADTRVDGPDGVYFGAVTASGDGQNVRTALAVNREVESYELTLTVTRRDGKRDNTPQLTVAGLDSGRTYTPYDNSAGRNGTVTLRLPKGRYLIDSQSTGSDGKVALLVAPGLTLDHDTFLALDGRRAKPVKVTAPDRRATMRAAQIVFAAHGARSSYDYADAVALTPGSAFLGQVGSAAPAGSFVAQVGGVWQHTATSPAYHLVTTRTGTFFDGLTRTYSSTRGMARVDAAVGTTLAHAQTTPQNQWTVPGWPALNSMVQGLQGQWRAAPAASLTQYLTTDYGLRWKLSVQIANGSHSDGVDLQGSRRFEPGRTYRITLNGGVYGPVVSPSPAFGGTRTGGHWLVCVPMFADGAGNETGGDATVRARLSSGSTVLGTLTDPCQQTGGGMPTGTARYRLAMTATRDKDYKASDRVETVWTFTSRCDDESKMSTLPLSVVRFHPKLSLTGTAKAGARVTVPLSLQGPAAAKGHLKSLTVRVSYDGGRTWKPVAVHTDRAGKRYLTLTHPKKPGTVSFRASLADTAGNTATETIHTAYRTVR
ncbi:S8 family peptidase [Streptomyces cyaneus]|uniref:S8 family peptidase n=1 Tax=Streptomyces cyaneus TaxID=1904 RepID=UPI0013E2F345|nr:S8 family peptidase [Streptomyces cyaneus]